MNIKVKMHKLATVLKNLDDIYDTYKSSIAKRARALEIKEVFDTLDFEWPIKAHECSHPIFAIGSALELADEYKIQIRRGTCHGDCVAYIDKEDWSNPIDTTACQHTLGVWCVRPWEEITSIHGYGQSVREAIVCCLIHAKRAGIINEHKSKDVPSPTERKGHVWN
jgi:hypothetical protein